MRTITVILTVGLTLGLAAVAYEKTSLERPPHGSLSARIAVSNRTITIGSPLVVRVTLTNTSSEDLVIRPVNNPWQWLFISDMDGKKVPKSVARIVNTAHDGPRSFIKLRPGESYSGDLTRQWITDKEQLQRIRGGTEQESSFVLDQVTDYNFITPGSYRIWLERRAVDSGQIKVNEMWHDIEEYFDAERFNGSFTSNVIEVKFTREPNDQKQAADGL